MTKVTRRQIIDQANELFGSAEDAKAWLRRPAIALERKTPNSMLRSERGRQVVSNLLLQLKYGVYV